MAIARKGSRKITVDGFDYLWKCSRNGHPHVIIFITCGGVDMKIVVHYPEHCKKIVKPREVKFFILQAIRDGWNIENPVITYTEEVSSIAS